jgi:hypothetical protein
MKEENFLKMRKAQNNEFKNFLPKQKKSIKLYLLVDMKR